MIVGPRVFSGTYISDLQPCITVIKPYETRPASTGTKKASGFCIVCGKVATTEALFQLQDAVIIQRYCDICLINANYVIGTH